MEKFRINDVTVNISELQHHPKNPRKDLGDLEELSKSLKKNGLLQNLTVIPVDENGEDCEIDQYDHYFVLIGNRRFEAAKMAGISQLNCNIVEGMDPKEQLSIMLEENMQRSDLTVAEQAEGFQMMLDLGGTVETIEEKTGFSKATIYHRLNLAKLDKDILNQKRDYQLSLTDYYELEKIEDIDTRNKILEEAASGSDLKYKANRAYEKEQFNKNKYTAVEWLNKHDIRKASNKFTSSRWSVTDNEKSTLNRWLRLFEANLKEPVDIKSFPEELPEDTFFEITDWEMMLKLYRPHPEYGKVEQKPETEEERKKREEQEQAEKEEKRLIALMKQFKEDFKYFVKGVCTGEISKPIELRSWAFVEYCWKKVLEISDNTVYDDDILVATNEVFKICDNSEIDNNQTRIKNKFNEYSNGSQIANQMLIIMVVTVRWLNKTWDYYKTYDDDNCFKLPLQIMKDFGINIEKETEKLIDGTHEYFRKDDK